MKPLPIPVCHASMRLLLTLLIPLGGAATAKTSWESAKVKRTVMQSRITVLPTGFSPNFIAASNATAEQQALMGASFASSATRRGCRVAVIGGGTIDGFTPMIDGIAGPKFAEIAGETPVFSEDGSSIAYLARRGLEWRWVINGEEGPAFSEITPTSFAFSADGSRHAYVVRPSFRKTVLVVDRKEQPANSDSNIMPWDAAPMFSADGKTLVFVEADNSKRQMRVNVNGRPGPWEAGIALSKSPAFGAYRRSSLNNLSFVERARPDIFSMVLSADGRHLAYGTFDPETGRSVMVSDGGRSTPCDSHGFDLVMTADGANLAYMMHNGQRRFIVRKDGAPFEIEGINDYTLKLSADGKHFAFMGKVKGTTAVWLDGKAVQADVETVSFGNSGSIFFSPNSKRLAFAAEAPGNKVCWIVDGKSGPQAPGQQLLTFDFSPDSAHFAYALPSDEFTRSVIIVVDGKPRASHPIVCAGPVFRADGVLEYLVQENGELCRYEVSEF